MNHTTVLWIYIAFLIAGGLMGFIKAKSRMSLIMSIVCAVPLILWALGVLNSPSWLPDAWLIFLLVFFGSRFAKSKKMMPNGLMTLLTIAALVLIHV